MPVPCEASTFPTPTRTGGMRSERGYRGASGSDAGKARAPMQRAAKHASRTAHCSNQSVISALLLHGFLLKKDYGKGSVCLKTVNTSTVRIEEVYTVRLFDVYSITAGISIQLRFIYPCLNPARCSIHHAMTTLRAPARFLVKFQDNVG
jgi:hypothetical protein